GNPADSWGAKHKGSSGQSRLCLAVLWTMVEADDAALTGQVRFNISWPQHILNRVDACTAAVMKPERFFGESRFKGDAALTFSPIFSGFFIADAV
ncbi:type II toxin-antitoxin system HicB family antitoxin, partial [Neisseria meningitidis]|uniref:type II toxin-antitoxin system HicB family antitoxin n=2 Tax=Neisseria meningitidis TaxID=487 RepID=UPI001F0CD9F5